MQIEPYSTLIKTTDNSNKIYMIYVKHLNKGDFLNTDPPKTTNKECYEVYTKYGKINGELRSHYYRNFFSLEAANRFAKRLHESKLQKKYVLHSNGKEEFDTSFSSIKKISNLTLNSSSKEKVIPLFDMIPQSKPRISINQKTRFLSLIE